jgi:hypothetical protein
VDWVVDTLVPFNSIKHLSFHRMIEAHSGTVSIRCANTVKNHVVKEANTSLTNLRAELEANCLTISLT